MNSIPVRIQLAREWVETKVPFLHLGRTAAGADCVGLLAYATGYPVAALPAYPRDPSNGQLERHLCAVLGEPVACWQVPPATTPAAPMPGGPPAAAGSATLGALQAGDIVAMAYGRPVRHVGIIAEHPALAGVLTLIHTDARVGRVVEHSLDDVWLSRIKLVHRV